MFDLDTLLGLIRQRNMLCMTYEEKMQSMITCDEDDLTSVAQVLKEISGQIDEVNRQIELLANGAPESRDEIISASFGRGSREDLNEDLRKVFDAAWEGFASLNRAENSSLIVTERIKDRLQEIEKQIRKLSVQPKIITYLNSGVASGTGGGKIDSNI